MLYSVGMDSRFFARTGLMLAVLLSFGSATMVAAYPSTTTTGVRIDSSERTLDGYTLIVPVGGPATGEARSIITLIDMAGHEVHRWTLPEKHLPTSARLLPDATLFVVSRTGGLDPRNAGSTVQELDWDGTVRWEYTNPDWHHDVERLPNGNIAGFRYHEMSTVNAKRVKGGLSGTEDPQSWYDDVIEVVDRDTKRVAWSWDAEEHLDIERYPLGPLQRRFELTHANSIQFLPAGNPLTPNEGFLVSFRQIDLVVAIDQATQQVTWEYGPGVTSKQHDATWLGGDRVLVFDNGMHRPATTRFGVPHSRILEVGVKEKAIEWTYDGVSFNAFDFLSPLWGGAQRLANGNTLITEGMTGRVFEVTDEKLPTAALGLARDPRIVWEYVSPHVANHVLHRTISKATRYSAAEITWPESLSAARPSRASTVLSSFSWSVSLPWFLGASLFLNGVLLYRRRPAKSV